jgi:hypothetical protein
MFGTVLLGSLIHDTLIASQCSGDSPIVQFCRVLLHEGNETHTVPPPLSARLLVHVFDVKHFEAASSYKRCQGFTRLSPAVTT